MRYLILLLILSTCIGQSFAQETFKGKVFENQTRITLTGVRIQNLRTKKFAETDDKGRFSIGAAINDLLVFNSFGYEPDTLFIISLKPAEVFLEPKKHMLNEVDVMGREVQSFKTYDPEFHNQTMLYQRDPKTGAYKGGVAFRIWSNKAEEKKERKLEQNKFTERIRIIIDTAFGLRNLSRYLPIKGDELLAFRERYIPTVKQYTDNDFNLLHYIDSCYKLFQALPPEKRLHQSLQSPVN